MLSRLAVTPTLDMEASAIDTLALDALNMDAVTSVTLSVSQLRTLAIMLCIVAEVKG